jgi:hypothetical protein
MALCELEDMILMGNNTPPQDMTVIEEDPVEMQQLNLDMDNAVIDGNHDVDEAKEKLNEL